MADNTQSTGSKILSALLIVYMIALVGSLFWFSQTEPKLVISSFGTMILLIGIACMTGSKETGPKLSNVLGALLFSLGGICMIAFPILLLYSPDFQKVDATKLGASMVAMLFMAIGATVWIGLFALTLYKLPRCTEKVQACATGCIIHRRNRNSDASRQGRRRKARSFLFTFTYGGQEYEVQDPIGSNMMDGCNEGDLLWIRINPENPKEFYRSRPITHTALFIVGAAALGMGLVCLMVLL